jgi:hypothetical protein
VDTSFAGSPFAQETSFTLAALVNTLPGSQIAFTSATLNGTVNPRSAAAFAWFQFGSTPAYGSNTSVQSLGNGTNDISLSQTLPQLLANTKYYYRAVASNQFGVAYGARQAFNTASNTPPVISSVANVATPLNTPTLPIAFSVSEAGFLASNLLVAVNCTDTALVPAANLVLGGNGMNRVLTIIPAQDQRGSAAITITVSDGFALAVQSFILNVGVVPGDLNGDGIVDQNELNGVLSNYWANSPLLMMTNLVSLGGGVFEFALTNLTGWNFSVLSSSNLIDWEVLPNPAIPAYRFSDSHSASGAPQKFYRLRYP